MRRIALAILVAVSTASAAFAAPVELEPATEARLDAGERQRVIVEFAVPAVDYARERGASDDEITTLIEQARNGALQRSFGRPVSTFATLDAEGDGPVLARAFRYTPAAAMILSADEIARLSNDPGVARIVEDRLDAPLLDQSAAVTGAIDMHNRGVRGVGTAVAILDTGVDLQHEMFTGRVAASACFSSTVSGQSTSLCPGGNASSFGALAGDNCEIIAPNGTGIAGCEHGTHVAGIAVGGQIPHPIAGFTLIGMAPSAEIVAVKVFSRFNSSQYCGPVAPCVLSYLSDQIAALEWLYEQRNTIPVASINMSLGGGRSAWSCTDDPRREIISALREAGIATVIATGNDGFDDALSLPACIPEAIAVGSRGSYSNEGFWRDLLAPGDNIMSAFPGRGNAAGHAAVELTGTSMAAPHVAGAIALLREAYPDASIDQVESALQVAADPGAYRGFVIRINRAADLIAPHEGNRLGSLSLDTSAQIQFEHHQLDGGAPPYRDFTITNTTGSDDSWIVSSDASWITFQHVVNGSPVGGTVASVIGGPIAAGQSATVRVSVAPEALGIGYYHSAVWFGSYTVPSRMPVPVHLAMLEPFPPNDDLASAFLLGSRGGLASFSNRFATAEADEPAHAGRSATRSLWWTLRPSESATYLITTDQASFDTVLSIYGGQSISTLSELGSNDDNPAGGTMSSVLIALTGGQTYHIAVDGYDDDEFGTGAVFARRSPSGPPPNDDIANATEIAGLRGRVDVDVNGATTNSNESEIRGGAVWYRWTAPASGRFVFMPRATAGSYRVEAFDFPNPVSQFSRGSYDPAAPVNATSVTAEAGETLYFGVLKSGSSTTSETATLYWYPAEEQAEPLRSALVPNNRAIQFGEWATAFATLANPASYGRTVEDCVIRGPADFTGEFHYQTTDPATNTPTGTIDTPVNLAPGTSQSFVISMRSSQTEMRDMNIEFVCANETAPVGTVVSSFRLSTMAMNWPDLINIAVTPTGNGILDLEVGRTSAFAVAVINAGGPGNIRIDARRWGGDVLGSFCETDPATGVCVTDRVQALQREFARGQVRTFTVFVSSGTDPVPLNPAVNRYGIMFGAYNPMISATAGSASVAIRTVSE